MHSTDNVDDGYLGSGYIIQRSIKKHGEEKHIREVVQFFSDRNSLREGEKELVTEEMLKDDLCMNLRKGGSAFGDEELQRMKNRVPWNKGKKGVQECSDETRAKMSRTRKGRKFTEEHKQKISKAHIGKIVSLETRRKQSEIQLGKKRGPHSDETRQKIGDAHRGMKHTEETKQKISEKNRGKPAWNRGLTASKETRRKQSEAHIGKKLTFSEEHCQRLSEAAKRREAKRRQVKLGNMGAGPVAP